MGQGSAVRERPRAPGRPSPPSRRDPQSLSPRLRVRRAVTLLALAVIVPGTAQLAAGNARLGRAVLRGWLALIALVALIGLGWFVARDRVLGMLAAPAVLGMVAIGCYLLAVVMAVLIVDAWRLGRPGLLPRRARSGIAALTAVLMVVACYPMLAVGRRAWAAADLISTVFSGRHSSAAVDGRYNVLLLGGDAGPDRIGTRPDSVTLVSIEVKTGRAVLFSLPRNLENVPFAHGTAAARAMPKGYTCGDACLLNAVYTWGAQHPSLFPGARDAGAEAMKQAVQGATGLTVNYYVLIDLKGFRQLIDAMGGIRVTVRTAVPIGGGTSPVSGYIQPGTQRLDGYHALWFARSRHGGSDYDRMARQRCVMDAMLHQLNPTTVLAKFQSIAAASQDVVSTDIPSGDLSTFLSLAVRAKSQKVTSIQFVPPLVNPAYPDFGVIRSKVRAATGTSGAGPATPTAGAPTGAGASRGSDPAGSSSAGAGGTGGSAAARSGANTSAGSGAVDVGASCSAA